MNNNNNNKALHVHVLDSDYNNHSYRDLQCMYVHPYVTEYAHMSAHTHTLSLIRWMARFRMIPGHPSNRFEENPGCRAKLGDRKA